MEKIKIKKEECEFDISKVKEIGRVDITTEGIEISFELEE